MHCLPPLSFKENVSLWSLESEHATPNPSDVVLRPWHAAPSRHSTVLRLRLSELGAAGTMLLTAWLVADCTWVFPFPLLNIFLMCYFYYLWTMRDCVIIWWVCLFDFMGYVSFLGKLCIRFLNLVKNGFSTYIFGLCIFFFKCDGLRQVKMKYRPSGPMKFTKFQKYENHSF